MVVNGRKQNTTEPENVEYNGLLIETESKSAARPNTREQSISTVIRKLYLPQIWTHEKGNQYNTPV
jgi:hypothetical protein